MVLQYIYRKQGTNTLLFRAYKIGWSGVTTIKSSWQYKLSEQLSSPRRHWSRLVTLQTLVIMRTEWLIRNQLDKYKKHIIYYVMIIYYEINLIQRFPKNKSLWVVRDFNWEVGVLKLKNVETIMISKYIIIIDDTVIRIVSILI